MVTEHGVCDHDFKKENNALDRKKKKISKTGFFAFLINLDDSSSYTSR